MSISFLQQAFHVAISIIGAGVLASAVFRFIDWIEYEAFMPESKKGAHTNDHEAD